MQYMLIIYGAEATAPQYGTGEFDEMLAGYKAFSEKYGKSGHMIAGEGLQDVDTATTVSVRDGKTTIVDGPFAETKEQLGGYYVIEAKDLDEATAIAAEIPAVKYGRIEIRPVMDYKNL